MKARNVVAEEKKVYGYAFPLEVNFIANGLPQVYNITDVRFLRIDETYKLIVDQINQRDYK